MSNLVVNLHLYILNIERGISLFVIAVLNEARMRESRGAYRVLVGRPDGKYHFDNLGLNGRIILK
jgi:hypothetical protein